MNKKLMLKMAKLADHFDKLGDSVSADIIDEFINDEANWVSSVKRILVRADDQEPQEIEIEIPEDERMLLEDVLMSLQDSLQ